MDIQQLDISLIRTNGGTQCQDKLSVSVIKHYAELMAQGIGFPPVSVRFDGCEFWLSDGFRRVAAAKRNGTEAILAEVPGSRRRIVVPGDGLTEIASK